MAGEAGAAALDAARDACAGAMTDSCPDVLRHLAPGATEAEIAAAEHAIGRRLPADLRCLLARHAGSGDAFAVPGFALFGPARVAAEWAVWEDLRLAQFEPEGYASEPVGPVRSDAWWRPDWVPFAGDVTGNHLCVDLDPAPGGEVGQVIHVLHDDARRTCLAPSLAANLASLAAEVRAGRIVWDDAWGGAVETALRDVEG